MRETLPENALLTNDAGNFSVFIHRYWRYNYPGTQLASTNGAMSYGVPAAVAAKLAAPDRTVVACCGDGGFLMTGQEIFFQAEDGIRDIGVTGVQTCALPISELQKKARLYSRAMQRARDLIDLLHPRAFLHCVQNLLGARLGAHPHDQAACPLQRFDQIGRASCRERV